MSEEAFASAFERAAVATVPLLSADEPVPIFAGGGVASPLGDAAGSVSSTIFHPM